MARPEGFGPPTLGSEVRSSSVSKPLIGVLQHLAAVGQIAQQLLSFQDSPEELVHFGAMAGRFAALRDLVAPRADEP